MMNLRHSAVWAVCLALLQASPAFSESINVSTNSPGRIPTAADGRQLNFNFETGDLRDWTATGTAWIDQPIQGEIDQNRQFGEGRRSLHTGEYWIGGYERIQDAGMGTLVSVPFKVTAPWASFLLGGGHAHETRVELVRANDRHVFLSVSGVNQEEMRPVVVNLQSVQDIEIQIRVIDESGGGWGHVNFDDFLFHDVKPQFQQEALPHRTELISSDLYPYENLSGEEAAQVMKVPEGFRVQLAAQEPDVQQPVAMAIDDRGRVWVAEAYAYPTRQPEGKGTDRILIFEDTDQDGVLDKRTVFVEGLNLVSGLQVGFGGVWVGAAPYVLFIPDRNGNDIPDGLEEGSENLAKLPEGIQFPKDIPAGAEVVLDGWAWQDTHETMNAFTWGPDGWLYGCHGVFTHSRVGKPGTAEADRTPLNAAVWRYHPTKKEFEIFSEGTSNPWGIDFNAYGDGFITACVIPHLYYVIPGGRYQRQAGQHFNSNTFDDLKTIARHRHFVGHQWDNQDRLASDDAGGGHAHAGAMIYQGGAWPSEYNGKLFMHNIHGNRVNVDVLIPEGSGYAGDRNPDFLLTQDKWSQMIDLKYGPDGQVWAIDWYDQNQCHHPADKMHDRSNGRIFRVSYGDAKPVQVNMGEKSNEELLDLAVNAQNEWYSRHARRLLQERADQKIDLSSVEQFVVSDADVPRRLRALWTIHVTHGVSEALQLKLLNDDSPHIRAWVIRLAHEDAETQTDAFRARLLELASHDPSPIVRLAIASSIQRTPLDSRWEILAELSSHAEDASDHNIPLLLWYAMEPLADVNPQRALALGMSAGDSIPLLREFMIRRLGSGPLSEALALLTHGLKETDNEEVRLTFLKGIRGALAGSRDVTPPEAWEEVYSALVNPQDTARNFDVYLYALGLGARFGNEQAATQLRQLVIDDAGPVNERKLAISFLQENRDSNLVDVISQLLQGSSLRRDAIRAVSTLDDPRLAETLVSSYKAFNTQERTDARNALASRPTYASLLLKEVQDNRIPKSELSADLVRQMRNLNDDQVNQLIEQVWGQVRETDKDRERVIAQYTRMLREANAPKGNMELGRAIFAKTCEQCHTLYGIGGTVGPDITGSNRADLAYLLSNILDPSAVMAKEYQPNLIALADGRILTGIVKAENDKTLTLQTANETIQIAQDDVEARQQSDTSMMPEDLLLNLSDFEVRSLVAYLAGNEQVAIQATTDNLGRFFNGTDLFGWRSSREADHQFWTVENGEIIGRSPGLKHNAFLMSELSLGDFHFSCDVLLKDNKGNSGIQFRSKPLSDGEMKGYQADIGPGWWGKLYEESARGLLDDNKAESLIKPGEWNRYEIIAVGSRIRTYLNGELAVDLNDPDGDRKGVIALQLHSGPEMEIRFKNLEVKMIDALPPYAREGSRSDAWPVSRPLQSGQKITWKKTVVDTLFRSEGCTIADFDNDGDMDIASGSVWYEQRQDESGNIHWVQHLVREEAKEFDPRGYGDTFMNFAEDINGDGWIDLVVVSFPNKTTDWFENPGKPAREDAGPWKRHMMIPVTNNESPQYLDIDGDGKRELICGVDDQVIAYAKRTQDPYAPWKIHPVSTPKHAAGHMFAHGFGAGDINGDGRVDLISRYGWWESPALKQVTDWKYHKANLGEPSAHMYVYDFDGDGDADVLSTSAHAFGMWWHEQIVDKENKKSTWKTHLIDESFSQTHAVIMADINGDGLPDFVTGKRWWAHPPPPPEATHPGDPGVNDPAVIAWFEFSREGGKPTWTKHQIDDNSGVGTQFEIADINGDGLLDIVVSSKKGTFVFEQVRE